MKCKIKLDLLQKTVLLLIGLVLITFSIQFVVYSVIKYRKKHEKIQEGMSASQMFNKLGKTFTSIGSTLEGVGKIIATIFALPVEINNLFTGIGNEFKCGQSEFDDGFKYGFQTFAIIVSCCWDKLKKVGNGKCAFYYFVDIIWGIFYGIFIMLPISLIDTIFGVDLLILITLFYDLFLAPIDALCFAFFGFHLFQWSDSVITQCYRCEGTINGVKVTQTVDEWAQSFNCTNAEISDGAHRMLEAVIPGPMWFQWFNGNTSIN